MPKYLIEVYRLSIALIARGDASIEEALWSMLETAYFAGIHNAPSARGLGLMVSNN